MKQFGEFKLEGPVQIAFVALSRPQLPLFVQPVSLLFYLEIVLFAQVGSKAWK